jgi:hypothetical protein
VLTIVLFVALVQAPAASQPSASAPQASGEAHQTWEGCLQAGTAPSTYRLNLDRPTSSATDRKPEGTQNEPFLQLVSGTTTLDLTKHVGKRVRLTGRLLTGAEAEQEAARRPNRQEANETAAGTGGVTQRHTHYVRVQTVTGVAGQCQ